MIAHIYKKSDGDWIVIEDSSGQLYRLSGLRREDLHKKHQEGLVDIQADLKLTDYDQPILGKDLPMIQNIVHAEASMMYVAEMDDGAEFMLTASELKAILAIE